MQIISMESAKQRWEKIPARERKKILSRANLTLNTTDINNYACSIFNEIPGTIKKDIAREAWRAVIKGLNPSNKNNATYVPSF